MTLEDATTQLHGRLKGLDSEIEESRHAMEELRGRVEDAMGEVEREWDQLAEAAASFLDAIGREQEQLVADVQELLRAAAGAGNAVREDGQEAQSELAGARATLDAHARRAAEIEPAVEALAVDEAEAPSQSFVQRARQAEQELDDALSEARDFLRDDVAKAMEQMAATARDRGHELRAWMAETAGAALQSAFDGWEAGMAALERYVAQEGFLVSHPHARAVVEWSMHECRGALDAQVASLGALVAEAGVPLEELSGELERVSEELAGIGLEMAGELGGAGQDLSAAQAALDAVRGVLSRYTFVQG